MSRPTKTETSTTVGKDTQKNRTHVPLMKTSHRFVMPDESPVINLPKSVCRSTNNVPIAAKIALRIKPAAETRIVRSICSSARLYNERMQRRVIGPVRMEQNERISHLDDKRGNRTNTDQGFHMAYRSLVVRGDSSILARHCRYKCETRKNEATMVTASSSRAIYRSRVPKAFTRPVRAW